MGTLAHSPAVAEREVGDDTLPALPRATGPIDNIAWHMKKVLDLLGMDINDASIRDTPMRVAKMLMSFNEKTDFSALLKVFDSVDTGGMVAQSRIPFQMLCEHHLLPAHGHAHIAYLPGDGRVVGLSKLARLVRAVGRERPSLQEAITDRIASLMKEHLKCSGVLVVVEAEHTCMTCRGVHAPGVLTSTSVVKGIFRDAPHAKQEAFALLHIR